MVQSQLRVWGRPWTRPCCMRGVPHVGLMLHMPALPRQTRTAIPRVGTPTNTTTELIRSTSRMCHTFNFTYVPHVQLHVCATRVVHLKCADANKILRALSTWWMIRMK